MRFSLCSHHIRSVAAIWVLFCLFLVCSRAYAQERGAIAGQLVHQDSQLPIEGALVSFEELNLRATTQSDGRFRFNQIPAGRYTLIVDYFGAGQESHPVSVEAGKTARPVIAFGAALREEAILVIGTVAGSRTARNRERASDNIKTVVGADSLGQFADQNVAESLQRLPGLTVQRDEGEGRFVSVRGLSPDFNQVTVNGVQVGSGGDGFDFSDLGGSRTVSLDVVPSDLLESIEVTKSRMADMDGDIVGGAIELQSLSAFDRGGFSAAARIEGSHNDFADETSPKLSGRITDIFNIGGGELGVALAAHWFDRDVKLNDVRARRVRSISTAGSADNPEFLSPAELDPRVEYGTRERTGVTLNLDYRPDENNEYYLRMTNTELQDDDVRYQLRVDLDDARGDELLEVGRLSGTFEDVDLEKRISVQEKENEVSTFVLGGKNQHGLWTLEYDATYSENHYELPEGLLARFKIRDTVTSFTIDDESYSAVFGPGPDDDENPALPANFVIDRINVFQDERTDEIAAYKLDLTRQMDFGSVPGELKLGLKYRTREKEADRVEALESDDEDVIGEISLAEIDLFSPNDKLDGFDFFPTRSATQGYVRSRIPALRIDSTQGNTPIEAVANRSRRDYQVEEDVLAAYLMTTLDFSSAWRLTAGVRVEQTDWTANAFEVERINRVEEDDGVEGVLEDETLPVVARQVERDYTDVLPSLHLRFEPRNDMIMRAALSTAIQRPRFNDAVPVRDIASQQQEVNDETSFEREIQLLGNPDLEPLEAVQFDWAVSWYPNKNAVLSTGVFFKQLDNFFIETALEGDDVTLLGFQPNNGEPGPAGGVERIERYTVNGDTAKVWGFEIAYAQNFANGLFVESNATLSDSEADLGEVLEQARGDDNELPLPDQADVIANLSFGWENSWWTLRTSWNYRDEQLVDPAGNPESDIIRDEYLGWDIGIKYRLSDRIGFYADFINLTEAQDIQVFRGNDTGSFVERAEDFGRTYQLGLTLTW